MSLSVEVRVAATMVGAGAVLGVALMVGSLLLLTLDDSFLFAVIPVVASLGLGAGLQLAGGSVWLCRRLLRQAPGARLSTGILGACVVLGGLSACAAMVLPGLFLVLYGGTLVGLMATPAASGDLGSWLALPTRRHRRGPDGQSRALPQPWWELWRAGLRQGLPPVDLVVTVGALSCFGSGLLAAALGAGLPGFAFVVAGLAGVVWVERRMRARLGLA